jgi:hypothetical protein
MIGLGQKELKLVRLARSSDLSSKCKEKRVEEDACTACKQGS